jgi:hypothetical protein
MDTIYSFAMICSAVALAAAALGTAIQSEHSK